MIVTLTTNTALDLTLFVDALVPDSTIRATGTNISMAGKPTDASYILGQLDIPSLALGFAASSIGQQIKTMLEQQGVTVDFVEVDGNSRINTVIIDEDAGTHTTITARTLHVRPPHRDALRDKLSAALENASCLVLGGSQPDGCTPDDYADYIRLAREKSVPVIFDADGANLTTGLTAQPDFIKPNRQELEQLLNTSLPDDLAVIYRAGREIQAKFNTNPIITLGDLGALAILPERAFHIPPLKVDVASPAGAGDAVLAGLAASFYRSEPIEEGLRLGVAAASAVIMQPGTAMLNPADVERFLPQVELIPFAGE